MATSIRSFGFALRRCQSRIVRQSFTPIPFAIRRQFTVSLTVREDEETKRRIAAELASDKLSAEEILGLLGTDDLESFEPLTDITSPNNDLPISDADRSSVLDIFTKFDSENAELQNMMQKYPAFKELVPVKPKPGFLNLGVERKDDPEEDPEFEGDDISSMAHEQLEQHREFREYARLAAWEMPLLTKMAKPFEPPTEKHVLRFRYTTYMGEEHPAEKKVVVEFCPADMPDLTSVQVEKLKKLAGVRYNPETKIIKMSCEMFETQAQNKRYLGDLVNVMLQEARDPTDTFEDIPLDTRHHTSRVKPKFPPKWRMTEERRAQLEAERQRALLVDQEKIAEGRLVDGVREIEETLSRSVNTVKVEAQTVPVGKARARPKKGFS